MSVWGNSRAKFRGKISRLPPIVAQACRDAMEEGAQEIVEAMRALVPVDTGKLRDSINWCWGSPPRGAAHLVSFDQRGQQQSGISDSRITIFAGDEDAFYARWVEFGTHARAPGSYRDEHNRKRNAGKRGHPATPAKPFFYPVWRAYKKRLISRISRKVNAAIKTLAQEQNG